MNWTPGGKYYEHSGIYRVSAARIVKRYRFTAWRKTQRGYHALGTFDTAREAKALCEQDARTEQANNNERDAD